MKRPAAGLIFLILLLGAMFAALFIPWNQVIETRVFALLPEAARSDDARVAREVMEGKQSRIILAVLSHQGGNSLDPAAADAFERSLSGNPAIERVESPSGDLLRDPGAVLFEHRFTWLLPGWLDEHFPDWERDPPEAETMAAAVVESLDAFLEDPGSYHAADLVPRDPFVLVPRALERFPAPEPSHTSHLKRYWITQTESPLDPAGQRPVFDALESARNEARDRQPGLKLDYTGVAPFAHASRIGIRGEITRLNLLTFGFVLATLGFFIRRFRFILPLAGLLLLSIAAALLATVAVFQTVHVLTLVIGAILVGVAIDYGLHILLHEPSPQGGKTLLRPLFTGAISTAGGFAFLLFSELPLLRQVGTFTVSGLFAALIFGLLLKRLVPDTVSIPYLTPRFRPFSRLPAPFAIPFVALAVTAFFLVSWHDDIRELDYPNPELRERDAHLRNAFDPDVDSPGYLVLGATPVEARENLDRWLADDPGKDDRHPGQWIPLLSRSESAWKHFRTVAFTPALREALDNADFEPDAFSPFDEDWESFLESQPTPSRYNRQVEAFADSLPDALSMLLQVRPELTWMLVRRDGAPESFDNLPPHVHPVRQLETLNASFALYRESSTRLILAGSLVLIILVVSVYRGYAPSCLFPPALAASASLGVASLVFDHLNLFHLIGLFLGTCIALDYALFATEQRRSGGNLPVSVPLSALTTFGTFAILATSAIGAVQALGFSVAGTVLFGFLLTLVRAPAFPRATQTGGYRP